MVEQEPTSRDVRNPEKLTVMRTLLYKRDSTVFMHLDPATLGVHCVIPERLKNQPQVVLQVGLDMPVPIPDLRVDAVGFHGTLSFGGKPFTCFVPWQAIFALVGEDGRGRMWPEDMPAPIVREMKAEAERQKFKAIDGEKADDLETRRTTQYLKPVKRERPSWMRVIEGEKKE